MHVIRSKCDRIIQPQLQYIAFDQMRILLTEVWCSSCHLWQMAMESFNYLRKIIQYKNIIHVFLYLNINECLSVIKQYFYCINIIKTFTMINRHHKKNPLSTKIGVIKSLNYKKTILILFYYKPLNHNCNAMAS